MPPYFCADCGRAVEPNATFCTGCGRPVARGAAALARRPARRGWKPLVIAAVVAIVLVPVVLVSMAAFRVWSVASEVQALRDEELPAGAQTESALVDWVEIDETAPPTPGDTYDLTSLDEAPELLNRAEVAEALTRNYPPLLRDGGVGGTVLVKMRVRPDGTVDPERLDMMEVSHPEFAQAAERVALRMRFRAGRIAGEPVAHWVVLPIDFQVQR